MLEKVICLYYISKGAVRPGSTEARLTIAHGGREYVLTGTEAVLWLNGQLEFGCANELWAVRHMHRMGLLEYAASCVLDAQYEMLTKCTLCLTTKARKNWLLSKDEVFIIDWMRQAGIHLSLAELVCLAERGIQPEPGLIGKEHRQALVEEIYTQSAVQDNTLENQMKSAGSRDRVVDAVLHLLKRRKLILL